MGRPQRSADKKSCDGGVDNITHHSDTNNRNYKRTHTQCVFIQNKNTAHTHFLVEFTPTHCSRAVVAASRISSWLSRG